MNIFSPFTHNPTPKLRVLKAVEYMIQTFLAVLLFALCFAGIAIRLILKKDKEFRGTCASLNPMGRNSDGTCSLCGQKATEPCPEEKENNSVIRKE